MREPLFSIYESEGFNDAFIIKSKNGNINKESLVSSQELSDIIFQTHQYFNDGTFDVALHEECKFIQKGPGHNTFIYEIPPSIRTISFDRKIDYKIERDRISFINFLRRKQIGHFDNEKLIPFKRNFRVLFPYTIICLFFTRGESFVKYFSFWRTSPLKTLNDLVYVPCLYNHSGDGSACLGESIRFDGSYSEAYGKAKHLLFNYKFNDDITTAYHFYDKLNFIQNPYMWEFLSENDKLFILKLNLDSVRNYALKNKIKFDDSVSLKNRLKKYFWLSHIVQRRIKKNESNYVDMDSTNECLFRNTCMRIGDILEDNILLKNFIRYTVDRTATPTHAIILQDNAEKTITIQELYNIYEKSFIKNNLGYNIIFSVNDRVIFSPPNYFYKYDYKIEQLDRLRLKNIFINVENYALYLSNGMLVGRNDRFQKIQDYKHFIEFLNYEFDKNIKDLVDSIVLSYGSEIRKKVIIERTLEKDYYNLPLHKLQDIINNIDFYVKKTSYNFDNVKLLATFQNTIIIINSNPNENTEEFLFLRYIDGMFDKFIKNKEIDIIYFFDYALNFKVGDHVYTFDKNPADERIYNDVKEIIDFEIHYFDGYRAFTFILKNAKNVITRYPFIIILDDDIINVRNSERMYGNLLLNMNGILKISKDESDKYINSLVKLKKGKRQNEFLRSKNYRIISKLDLLENLKTEYYLLSNNLILNKEDLDENFYILAENGEFGRYNVYYEPGSENYNYKDDHTLLYINFNLTNSSIIPYTTILPLNLRYKNFRLTNRTKKSFYEYYTLLRHNNKKHTIENQWLGNIQISAEESCKIREKYRLGASLPPCDFSRRRIIY